jgi:pimeloyl-ACP methyl ester carboxylesterase
MAQDVSDLAASLGVRDGYATLGHSYGAFVVLHHAVDHPGSRAARSCRRASPPHAGLKNRPSVAGVRAGRAP